MGWLLLVWDAKPKAQQLHDPNPFLIRTEILTRDTELGKEGAQSLARPRPQRDHRPLNPALSQGASRGQLYLSGAPVAKRWSPQRAYPRDSSQSRGKH